MSLLAVTIVKNSHILDRIYFIALQKCPKKLECLLIPNLGLSEKFGKAVVCNLLSLILGQNCVKALQVTEIVK